MHRLLLRLILIGSCFGQEAAAQAVGRGSVDYARLADAVVNRTLKVEKGERVVLFWGRASDRGLAAALRARMTKTFRENS
jgi:hypothetical protein